MSLPLVKPIVEVPHGLKRYRHRMHKCRCEVCRKEWANYIKGYRLTKKKRKY